MIGEIRDRETAEMAVQAALTGHLVLSTLHTNDAPSAIARLTEVGVPPYLISATLIGVVAQRLVRTLCPHCKEPTELAADEWKALVHPMKLRRPTGAFTHVGCDECRHTGYYGRIGIYEIMAMSNSLRAMVDERTDTRRMREQAIAEQMRPLRISGAQKVQAGITTIAEVFGVVAGEV